MPQLSFDADGRVYGLEDVDFEIPYPSKNQDDQRKFQEQVEALAKHAEDEPNRPIYMASRLPKEMDQTGFAICYREVGLIVGFTQPGIPTPVLYGRRQLPLRPRPMTLRIEFSDQYMKSYVGKALDENLGFEVKYEEGMTLPEVPDRLVLVPIPAVPAVIPFTAPTLKIGGFHLRSFDGTDEGGIWIEHPNGETMQCRPEDLEKYLDALWEEKF